jgi:hypothetical protein
MKVIAMTTIALVALGALGLSGGPVNAQTSSPQCSNTEVKELGNDSNKVYLVYHKAFSYVWLYQETNRVAGLQRGATGPLQPGYAALNGHYPVGSHSDGCKQSATPDSVLL